MGYTQSIRATEPFTDTNWNKFVKEAKEIFETNKSIVANGFAERATRPFITDEYISFNGIGNDSYETCIIRKNVFGDCCKTGQKPYDSVVVQIYKLARKYNSSIALRSDGGTEVFAELVKSIEKPKVAIYVSGGVVQSIISNIEDVDFVIVDEDNDEDNGVPADKQWEQLKLELLNIHL